MREMYRVLCRVRHVLYESHLGLKLAGTWRNVVGEGEKRAKRQRELVLKSRKSEIPRRLNSTHPWRITPRSTALVQQTV